MKYSSTEKRAIAKAVAESRKPDGLFAIDKARLEEIAVVGALAVEEAQGKELARSEWNWATLKARDGSKIYTNLVNNKGFDEELRLVGFSDTDLEALRRVQGAAKPATEKQVKLRKAACEKFDVPYFPSVVRVRRTKKAQASDLQAAKTAGEALRTGAEQENRPQPSSPSTIPKEQKKRKAKVNGRNDDGLRSSMCSMSTPGSPGHSDGQAQENLADQAQETRASSETGIGDDSSEDDLAGFIESASHHSPLPFLVSEEESPAHVPGAGSYRVGSNTGVFNNNGKFRNGSMPELDLAEIHIPAHNASSASLLNPGSLGEPLFSSPSGSARRGQGASPHMHLAGDDRQLERSSLIENSGMEGSASDSHSNAEPASPDSEPFVDKMIALLRPVLSEMFRANKFLHDSDPRETRFDEGAPKRMPNYTDQIAAENHSFAGSSASTQATETPGTPGSPVALPRDASSQHKRALSPDFTSDVVSEPNTDTGGPVAEQPHKRRRLGSAVAEAAGPEMGKVAAAFLTVAVAAVFPPGTLASFLGY